MTTNAGREILACVFLTFDKRMSIRELSLPLPVAGLIFTHK